MAYELTTPNDAAAVLAALIPAALGGPTGAKRLDIAHGAEADKSGATFALSAGYGEWTAAVPTPGGTKDPVLFLGYNAKVVGNRAVTSEPAAYWALEGDYANATFRAMEQYPEHITANGSFAWRPWIAVSKRDATTGETFVQSLDFTGPRAGTGAVADGIRFYSAKNGLSQSGELNYIFTRSTLQMVGQTDADSVVNVQAGTGRGSSLRLGYGAVDAVFAISPASATTTVMVVASAQLRIQARGSGSAGMSLQLNTTSANAAVEACAKDLFANSPTITARQAPTTPSTGNLIEATNNAGTAFSGMNKDGYLFTALNAAPADADLVAGKCMFWFDSTNGAAKLKIKGKSANGTVVAGEVALA